MFDDSVYSSIWESMNSWFTPTVLFVLLNVMIGTIAFTSSLANQKPNHPKHEQQHQLEDYSQQQHQQPLKITRSPSILQRIKSINFHSYRSQEPVKSLNFDPSHQQETTAFDEPQTHYIFEPSHEHSSTIEPVTAQYIFNQSHQQNAVFQRSHLENLQESQTQYLFHESKLENMEHSFHFQQETPPEKSTQYIFQHTHEQKPENIDTHFDFQQTHEDDEEEEGELKSLDEVYNELKERHVSRSRSDTKPSAGEAPVKLPSKMKKSASMKSPFAHFEEEDIVEARRPATTREKNVAKNGDGDNEVDAKADDFINKFKQQLKLQRVDSILRYKEMIGRGS